MTFLAIGIIAVWLVGLLCIAGLYLNDIRLVLNNHVLEKRASTDCRQSPPPYLAAASLVVPSILDLMLAAVLFLLSRRSPRFDERIAGKIDPASLNETGRAHLQRTIRHEWAMLAWIVGGFIVMVWWLS